MSSFLNRATSIKTSSGKKSTADKAKHYSSSKARPSDALAERFNQWKHINKSLVAYYESIRDGQLSQSKEYQKQAAAIPVPFHEGDQFLQDESGFQGVFYSLRDHTRSLANYHNDFARAIDNEVLAPLNQSKNDIKSHSDLIDSELGKLSDVVDSERTASTKAISEHTRGVSLIGSQYGHNSTTAKQDPYVTHGIVEKQLAKQLDQENNLTKSTIHFQKISETLEHKIVESSHTASKAFMVAMKEANEKLAHEWSLIDQKLTSVPADREWTHFSSNTENRLIDPSTTLRDPNLITFPDQGHESVKAVKQGPIERKKRFTKNYKEYYLVLTKAGFLHEYPVEHVGSNDPKHLVPSLSLFLPEFTLGPPSSTTDKKHKFHLTGQRRMAAGKDSSKGMTLGLNKKKEVAYTFKARSHADMQSWWDAVESVVKTSLTASEPSTDGQTGVISNAVNNVGLAQPGRSAETASQVSAAPSSSFVTSNEDDRSALAPSSASTVEATHAEPTRTYATHQTVTEGTAAVPSNYKNVEPIAYGSNMEMSNVASHNTVAHTTTAETEEADPNDAESDVESRGGSSVEEEEEERARTHPGTPAGVLVSADGQHELPVYSGTAADVPVEKKSAFDNGTNSGEGSSIPTHSTEHHTTASTDTRHLI